MAKRHKKHEEHIDESWLIPYADILTLLLALFIVLFAASSTDAAKFERLAESFRVAFTGGTGVLDYDSQIPPEFINDLPSSVDRSEDSDQEPGFEDDFYTPEETDEKSTSAEDDADLEELMNLFADEQDFLELLEMQRRINQYIQQRNLELSLQTELTKDGLMITIANSALFASGSATVRTDAEGLAKEISNLLVSDPPRRVEIAGHTDADPISNAFFRSNWDLSAMRAINFLKIILENDQLDPRMFSAGAYGEFQPVAPNDTPENKAKNRRVEVLVLPRT